MSNNLCKGLPKLNPNIECGNERPKTPFTVINNGKDGASVINQKGEDVTEYFNIKFHGEVIQVDFKKAPSFDEWRKIAGK